MTTNILCACIADAAEDILAIAYGKLEQTPPRKRAVPLLALLALLRVPDLAHAVPSLFKLLHRGLKVEA